MNRRKSLAPQEPSLDYFNKALALTSRQRQLLQEYQQLYSQLVRLNEQILEITRLPTLTLENLQNLEAKLAIVHTLIKSSVHSVDARGI